MSMSLYTIVLCKFTCVLVKKQLWSWQRQLGKTVVVNMGVYIVSMDRKTTIYELQADKIVFFENAYKLSIVTRSRISLAMPVSSSLYRLYSSRARLQNSVWYSPSLVTRWCNNLSLAGKRPVRIKIASNSNSIFAQVPGFHSAGHKY